MSDLGLRGKIKKTASMEYFFSSQEMRDQLDNDCKIVNIEVNKLLIDVDYAWTVREESEEYVEILESIREIGIISPLTVVAAGEDEYRVVSGRRRKVIAEQLGLIAVPCIIIDTDDEYLIQKIRNDSNLKTRREILPSEKAKAYKLELEALKHQGKRISTSSPLGTKLRTDEIIAQNHGDTRTQVERFIRLNMLIPEILSLVDRKQIAMRPALELAALPVRAQEAVFGAIDQTQAFPSHSQARRMVALDKDGSLNKEAAYKVMTEVKPNQEEKVSIHWKEIEELLPADMIDHREIEKYIVQALKAYRN